MRDLLKHRFRGYSAIALLACFPSHVGANATERTTELRSHILCASVDAQSLQRSALQGASTSKYAMNAPRCHL